MIRTLIQLQWLTIRGRAVRSIRLLKQPKYLVGSLVGVAWMFFWIVRPILKSEAGWNRVHVVGADMIAQEFLPAIHLMATFGLTMIIMLSWLYPWGKLGLGFREAELTMLLQAPLTRRQIIGYGLFKSMTGAAITAFFITLFLGAGGLLERIRSFIALFLLFLFWDLNSKWRALFLLRQREVQPSLAWARRIGLTVGLAGYLSLLGFLLVRFQLSVFGDGGGGSFDNASERLHELAQQVSQMAPPPMLESLLKPGSLLTAPLFAETWTAFGIPALVLLGLVIAQRELVVRSPAHFEESLLEAAESEENKKSPTRRFKKLSSRARDRAVFPLASLGSPEFAIVWKNLMRVTRVPLHLLLLGGCASIALLAAVPVVLQIAEASYVIMLIVGWAMLIVPAIVVGMAWSNDMRTEFGHIELLRTWPIRADRFVLAQVASPAVLSFMVSVLGAAFILAAWIGTRLLAWRTGFESELNIFPDQTFGVGSGLGLTLLLLGVLPLNASSAFMSSAMQNLAVLFVPAWMAETGLESKGIPAFGRRLVFGMGVGLAFMIALVPSALVVGLAMLLQRFIGIPWSAWAFPLWGVLAAAPLFVGGYLVVQLAGRLWRNLDPSEEVLEIGS